MAHLHNGGHMLFPSLFSRKSPHSSSGSGGVAQHKSYRALLASALSFCLFTTLLVAVQPAFAQESSAAIVGTVVDPSGAAVNGATITAKDVDRGTSLTTQTNETGS